MILSDFPAIEASRGAFFSTSLTTLGSSAGVETGGASTGAPGSAVGSDIVIVSRNSQVTAFLGVNTLCGLCNGVSDFQEVNVSILGIFGKFGGKTGGDHQMMFERFNLGVLRPWESLGELGKWGCCFAFVRPQHVTGAGEARYHTIY